MARKISVLGSTGSIGDSTLDLLRRAEPGVFDVVALTANRNYEKLAAQALEFKADCVAIANAEFYAPLKDLLSGSGIEVTAGSDAVEEAGGRPADFTMAAIVGAAGLRPTLAAVKQGKTVGLANKECLVCAGHLFMDAVRSHGTALMPVDSEHNAIFQVLEADKPEGVRRLILTASGGPFRGYSAEQLKNVRREDALNHPVWDMGAKITVDSASLMNKGLELIEAAFLFDRPSSEIDVIIHPQSVVHSMVEYIDGSVLAQMGTPDMRTPIAYALGWPERYPAPVERLDLTRLSGLTFFEPDVEAFPALRLARSALEAGGNRANVLNAANEVAVSAFLNNQIGFTDIPRTVERVLEAVSADTQPEMSVEAVTETDRAARAAAQNVIKAL